MNRVIVLGIDALEYTLVEEWDLKYLKQERYCKIDLSDFDIIVTPPIWGSMITGKVEQELMMPFKEKKKKEMSWWWKLGMKLPKLIKFLYWKHVNQNPFDKTSTYYVGHQTIFDFFINPWNNGIPSYGRNVSPRDIRLLTIRCITEKNVEPLLKYAKKEFEIDKEKLFNALKENYDLIFWYTPSVDRIGHRLFHNKLYMMNLYFELNQMIREVKKIAGNDVIYIVSDHGMILDKKTKSGEHSSYGFFSSNTGECIKKPQDLFYLIKEKSPLVRRCEK